MRYTYDLANNVASITDARGVTATYTYDTLERVSQVRYPNRHAGKDETVRYTYDSCELGKGRLCGVADESGTSAYRYDAWGNVVEMRHTELGVEYVRSYSYDAGDRVIRQTLASGRAVAYSRDALRRVAGVRAVVNSAEREIVGGLRYRADDRMTYCRYGNGLEEQRAYDLQGRLVSQQLSTAVGLSVHQREYAYDANGNIVRLSVDGLARRYAYDGLDRLVEDGGVSPAARYVYDLNGNRQRRDLADASWREGYAYAEGSNRVALVEGVERTDEPPEPGSHRLRMEYNDAGRLWRLYENDELVAEYIYNAAGQRTRKVIHEGETQVVTVFHYGPTGELQTETDAQGRLLRDYVWANGMAVAQVNVSTGSGGVTSEQLVYLYADHLQTPRVGTDVAGRIVWRWEGDAFGATAADTDPDGDGTKTQVALRFPGQYWDAESGWHYNWNRYYEPTLGRYITSDPLGLIPGLMRDPSLMLPREIRWHLYRESTTDLLHLKINHLYGYAYANPLTYVDPFGLEPDCKYYDKRCYEDGGHYYCTCAPRACGWSWWPILNEQKAQCIRECLQQEDFRCDPTPGERSEEGIDMECNVKIHRECWAGCW